MSAGADASNCKRRQEFPRRGHERWCELVGDLPDIRLGKVLDTRRALRHRMYDGDDVLEETLRLLGNEVGILCRCEPKTDSR